MAELFGTAAGILQVAEVGFNLATTLYKYASTVKSAERDIRRIARDVKLTSKVLERTHEQLKADQQSQLCTDDALVDLEDVLEGCREAFKEVDDSLNKSMKPPNGKIGMSLAEKLRWPLKQDKLEVLRANLEKLKTTLLLMLSVFAYGSKMQQTQAAKREIVAGLSLEKLQIQNLIQAKDEATSRYEQLSAAFTKLETRINDSARTVPPPASPSIAANMISMMALTTSDRLPSVEGQYKDRSRGESAERSPVSKRLKLCASAVSKLTATIEVATKRWEGHRVLEHENITRHLQETADAVHVLKEPVAGPELPSALAEFFNSQPSTPTLPSTSQQGAVSNSNHALQNYELQLMLLEKQKKKRLLMARQEQQSMMSTEHLYDLPQSEVRTPAEDSSTGSMPVTDIDFGSTSPIESRDQLLLGQTIANPDYEQRHDFYASPRTSTGSIPVPTQPVINSPPPFNTRPQRRYDSYTGRPRRASVVDTTQVTAGRTNSSPNRSRPTVIQQDLAEPAAPQHAYSDYSATLASLEESNKRTSAHKKLYSIDDGDVKLVADVNNDAQSGAASPRFERKRREALISPQTRDEFLQHRYDPYLKSPEYAAQVSPAQAASVPPPPRPRSGSRSRPSQFNMIASYAPDSTRLGPPPSTSAYYSYDHLPMVQAYQAQRAQQYHESAPPAQAYSYPQSSRPKPPAPPNADLYPGFPDHPAYTGSYSARTTSLNNTRLESLQPKPAGITRTVSARCASDRPPLRRKTVYTESTESESDSTEDETESEYEDDSYRRRTSTSRKYHNETTAPTSNGSRRRPPPQQPVRRAPLSDTGLEYHPSSDIYDSDRTQRAVVDRSDRRNTLSARSSRRPSVSTTASSGRTKATSLSSAADASQLIIETQSGRRTAYLTKQGQADIARSQEQKLNDQLEQQRIREETIASYQRNVANGEPYELTAENIKSRKRRKSTATSRPRARRSDGVLIKSGDITLPIERERKVEMLLNGGNDFERTNKPQHASASESLDLDLEAEDEDEDKDPGEDEDFAEVDSLLRRWTKLPLAV